MLVVEANLPFIILKYNKILLGHAGYLRVVLVALTKEELSMRRYNVTYPPEMLPKSDHPETAEVIIYKPPLNDSLRSSDFSLEQPKVAGNAVKQDRLQ